MRARTMTSSSTEDTTTRMMPTFGIPPKELLNEDQWIARWTDPTFEEDGLEVMEGWEGWTGRVKHLV